MMDLTAFLFVAAATGSFGYRLAHDPIKHPPKGAFLYRGFDGAGALVVHGWLVINEDDAGRVDGEWCLDQVGSPENIGPQIGLGSLRGKREGAMLSLNLNPFYADFNVTLDGSFNTVSFKGTWRYNTIRGTVGVGTFEAVRSDGDGR
jgi:hypothetical protein